MVVSTTGPVRIAVANDYEVVVHGLVSMLEPFRDRVDVVEVATDRPVCQRVDLVLIDVFGRSRSVRELREQANGNRVAVYGWDLTPALIEAWSAQGITDFLHKGLPASRLVEAIEAIHAGEHVVVGSQCAPQTTIGDWPGQAFGLSERESEVVALITQGLSNDEIAERTFLSINTVKSYIRTAYRKMNVGSRSKAVLWGLQHGFGIATPELSRALEPDEL